MGDRATRRFIDSDPSTCDVTVVIPFFNSSASLGRALASVESQTRAPRETIVVDDGSIPFESEEAAALVSGATRTRLIVLPSNMGAGAARNVGWEAASTRWVAFLDSDDAWHPRKLELQLRCAQGPLNPALIACRAETVAGLDEFSARTVPDKPHFEAVTLRQLLIKNRWSTPTVMIRRELPLRFPERQHAEDWECWLRVAALGLPMLKIDCALVALFKRAYGDAGLSAQIGDMIRGEYVTLWCVWRSGEISLGAFLCAGLALSARVARRLFILAWHRLSAL